MKSLLIFLVIVSSGFALRAFASWFERWVERADWVRVDRILSAACGIFLTAVALGLVAVVVNSAVTTAIAQAAR